MIARQIRSVVPVSPDSHGFVLAPSAVHPAVPNRSPAVLLCHGFTGSPASMRPWAEQLAARGYHVDVPRLPGHGTSWREMNLTEWTDWYDRVEQQYLLLAARHDVVMVGGMSMGGCLAIRLAQQHQQIPALALVNPSIGTYDRTYRLLPLLCRFVDSTEGIAGDICKPGTREPAYERTPLRAAASMRRLWADVTAHLDRYTAPTLVFRSAVDHVVDDASVDLLRTLPQVSVRTLERSYHVATLDHDAEQIGTESADFFDRYVA